MPLASSVYTPGGRRPLGSTNRSPIGGCWIVDQFFPFNWWLLAGTKTYYVAWVLNIDGIPINYQPASYVPENLRVRQGINASTEEGRAELERIRIATESWKDRLVIGFRARGRRFGGPGRSEVYTLYVKYRLAQYSRGSRNDPSKNRQDVPAVTPGYEQPFVFGVSWLTPNILDVNGNPVPRGPNQLGSYSTNPTVVEYPVGITILQRYIGLQIFVEQTRAWVKQGMGSNPYRYFLNSISTIPQL
jgi:hypothetical protein